MPVQDHSGKPKDHGSGESRQSSTRTKSANWFHRIGAMEILTFVLACAAAVQLWGYIKGERAFVYVENVTLPRGFVNVDPLLMRLEIKNAGKSVATINDVAASITQGPLPPQPQYAGAPKFALAPAVPGGVVRGPLKFDLVGGYSEEKVRRLRSGAEAFYLFGLIRYSDGYGFPSIFGFRETAFCFVYAPDGGNDGFETCREPAYTYAN